MQAPLELPLVLKGLDIPHSCWQQSWSCGRTGESATWAYAHRISLWCLYMCSCLTVNPICLFSPRRGKVSTCDSTAATSGKLNWEVLFTMQVGHPNGWLDGSAIESTVIPQDPAFLGHNSHQFGSV
jgi:hypothetical protein